MCGAISFGVCDGGERQVELESVAIVAKSVALQRLHIFIDIDQPSRNIILL